MRMKKRTFRIKLIAIYMIVNTMVTVELIDDVVALFDVLKCGSTNVHRIISKSMKK